MQDKHKSFVLYKDSIELINLLSDEEAGILLKSLFMYVQEYKAPQIDSREARFVFNSIKQYLDRDHKSWIKKCERNRINQIKRWAKNKNMSVEEYLEYLSNEKEENSIVEQYMNEAIK